MAPTGGLWRHLDDVVRFADPLELQLLALSERHGCVWLAWTHTSNMMSASTNSAAVSLSTPVAFRAFRRFTQRRSTYTWRWPAGLRGQAGSRGCREAPGGNQSSTMAGSDAGGGGGDTRGGGALAPTPAPPEADAVAAADKRAQRKISTRQAILKFVRRGCYEINSYNIYVFEAKHVALPLREVNHCLSTLHPRLAHLEVRIAHSGRRTQITIMT